MAKYESLADARKAVLDIAKAEVGYLEKKSASNLDSRTANAGNKNYTKYWRDLNDWKLFNYKPGWAGGSDWYWCAAFVTWCYYKAFGKDIAKKMLFHLPFINCEVMYDKAKAAGRLREHPFTGDIVLFYSTKQKKWCHTGIVFTSSKTGSRYCIRTYEGNTSSGAGVVANGGCVAIKSYEITPANEANFRFVRPDYQLGVKDKVVITTLAAEKPSEATESTKAETKKTTTVKYKINTLKDPLRCREKPNTDKTTKILGKFKKGATVTLVKKTRATFYKVKGKDMTSGKTITGYCAVKYLKKK